MTALTDELRARLRAYAAEIAPGGHGLPSASDVGLHDALIDRVVAVAPRTTDAFVALLATLPDEDVGAAVRALHADDPAAAGLLTTVVAHAYLLSPEVRDALGYPGTVPVDVGSPTALRATDDGLLEAVVRRGPICRDPGA